MLYYILGPRTQVGEGEGGRGGGLVTVNLDIP